MKFRLEAEMGPPMMVFSQDKTCDRAAAQFEILSKPGQPLAVVRWPLAQEFAAAALWVPSGTPEQELQGQVPR